MAFKIFKRGGYFIIVDTDNGRERTALAKNVRVSRGTETKTDFFIYGVNDWDNDIQIPLANIQDENGSSYTLTEFINFFEVGATAQDVSIQDSTAPIIIVPFSQLVTETTVAIEPALDDYIINVTSATSFVVGHLLTLYNIASNKVFFARVLEINTLAITLDSPIDFEFPVGSFVSVGITDMAVNGSVTPQIFGVRNPTNQDIPLAIDVTRIIFAILTAGGVDLSKFGDIVGGLDRGVLLRTVNGNQRNVFNAKTNAGLKLIMYDVDVQVASGNQQDGLTGRLTFGGQEKLGAVIRLKAGEDLQMLIQDDLTSLEAFTITAEGSEVTN